MKLIVVREGFKPEIIDSGTCFVFIIEADKVLCIDPSVLRFEGSVYRYPTEEDRQKFLCQEHQDIVNEVLNNAS